MKQTNEAVACVVDYGTFLCVAEKLAEKMRKVYYHTPCETEYQSITNNIVGTGLERVVRCDDPLDPDVFDEIDLFVFPDIGMTGLQRHLRDCNKAVWGSMGGTELELYRTHFYRVVANLGLAVAPYVVCNGMDALDDHLRSVRDKWVKVDRYRGNMETWHHDTYDGSVNMLRSMRNIFGEAAHTVTFVVQDAIASDIEIGHDGWCVDGKFTPASFQGYEKKDELYIGRATEMGDLPDEVLQVNEAFAPVLASYGYRNWWSTEIRIANGIPYFIDPTPRIAGLCGEQLIETNVNIADVIWNGANGKLIKPRFAAQYAVIASLHHKNNQKDAGYDDMWRALAVPPSKWIKYIHYFVRDDRIACFPPRGYDEIGNVIGVGDSIEAAIAHLMANMKVFDGTPVYANVDGFVDLVAEIKAAEKEGVPFGGRVPSESRVMQLVK